MNKGIISFRNAAAMLTALSAVSCSQSSSNDVAPATITAPAERVPTAAEIEKLYDSNSLVEVKTLSGFPEELKTIMGVHETGYSRIADVGEECDPTDAIAKNPGRCFFVGGLSDTAALIAFKIGDFAGQRGVAVAYVCINSKWIQVRHWTIGYPSSLNELRQMTSFPPDTPL